MMMVEASDAGAGNEGGETTAGTQSYPLLPSGVFYNDLDYGLTQGYVFSVLTVKGPLNAEELLASDERYADLKSEEFTLDPGRGYTKDEMPLVPAGIYEFNFSITEDSGYGYDAEEPLVLNFEDAVHQHLQLLVAETLDLSVNSTGSSPRTSHYYRKVRLLKVEFETFPDDVSGPDNAHKINLSTRQKEATFYGEFEKSVSHIWETDQTVDLIDYLTGSDDPSMRTAFEQALEWRRSNGEVLDGHELNYGLRPDSDEIERFDIEVLAKGSSTVLDRLILGIVPPETLEQFNTWYTAEADMGWLNELPALYWRFSFEQEGTIDPTLVPIDPEPANCDPQRWKGFSDSDTYYHPDGYYKARSEETQNGHGHQAIYTQNAVVIKSGVSAGSADKEVPFPTNLNPAPHVNADVKPFIWAAQLDGNPVEENVQTMTAPLLHEGSNIQRYFERRPAVANGDYLIPGLDDLVPGECDQ
jgi:hypothetical protein